MDEIRIDQLTLKLSGLTEQDGRRLAQRIAEGLSVAELSAGGAQSLATLHVRIADSRPAGGAGSAAPAGTGHPAASVDALSQHVVAEIVRQLQRSL